MTYLLDTDHFVTIQRQSEPFASHLSARMAQHSVDEFAVSILTFHELAMGAHKLINDARKRRRQIITGYELLQIAFVDYQRFTVLAFDEAAQDRFDAFPGNLRVGATDLRIAAVALANDLTLLTRNSRDFARVPNLKFEDWTVTPPAG